MISFAAHLKRQSPSMFYEHGWIIGDKGLSGTVNRTECMWLSPYITMQSSAA